MKKLFLILTIAAFLPTAAACADERTGFPSADSSSTLESSSALEPSSTPEPPSAPEPPPENGATATFQLGLAGTDKKDMRVGDTIGGWTLSDLQISYDESDNVEMLESIFSGEVTLKGTISRNMLVEEGYDFAVSEEDREKMPHYISPQMEQNDVMMFMLTVPDSIPNAPKLTFEETWDCSITISDYRFIFAYMTAPAGATVVSINDLP